MKEDLSSSKKKLKDSEVGHQVIKDKLESMEMDLEVLRFGRLQTEVGDLKAPRRRN